MRGRRSKTCIALSYVWKGQIYFGIEFLVGFGSLGGLYNDNEFYER